jgi:hypothetical protein
MKSFIIVVEAVIYAHDVIAALAHLADLDVGDGVSVVYAVWVWIGAM